MSLFEKDLIVREEIRIRTRVNAVIRILKCDKVIEALEYIIDSVRINKEEPKAAVQMAKEALREIKSNKFTL